MARRKVLPIFRTRNENGELKELEMQNYRESLGDRKLVYTITKQDKYKESLTVEQLQWIDKLLKTFAKYDILGSNQIDHIIELSEIAVKIDELDKMLKDNPKLATETDEYMSDVLGFHCIKLSQFMRYKDRLENTYEKLFYQYLNVNLDLFETLQYDNVDELEVENLQTNPKLLLAQLGGMNALLKKGN
ncbi:TPA: hypothetical protein KRE82_003596 [Clostridioides difficile]|nr:hypothetical protein [Clostridioides difficile]